MPERSKASRAAPRAKAPSAVTWCVSPPAVTSSASATFALPASLLFVAAAATGSTACWTPPQPARAAVAATSASGRTRRRTLGGRPGRGRLGHVVDLAVRRRLHVDVLAPAGEGGQRRG